MLGDILIEYQYWSMKLYAIGLQPMIVFIIIESTDYFLDSSGTQSGAAVQLSDKLVTEEVLEADKLN